MFAPTDGGNGLCEALDAKSVGLRCILDRSHLRSHLVELAGDVDDMLALRVVRANGWWNLDWEQAAGPRASNSTLASRGR